jgi:hypothetical protein
MIGKPAILKLCTKMMMKVEVAQAMPVNTDPHYSNALPSNIDFERLSTYFAFRPHDVIQNTLRQTTQLGKPLSITP